MTTFPVRNITHFSVSLEKPEENLIFDNKKTLINLAADECFSC
jgi:hypothetical protein